MKIELTNLSVEFGDKKVIDNLSLCIDCPKVAAIFGSSGCGKTTLLRVISGLLKNFSGNISVEGKISYMFQEDRLLPWLSVSENILSVLKKPTQEERGQMKAILRSLGLCEYESADISSLSGGQKRRVALARALISKSDIILLDEPFNGLDDASKEDAIKLIKEYRENHIIIFVSHDRDDIEKLADTVITL